jgi:nucleoside-diphosphate-sugar epimerase
MGKDTLSTCGCTVLRCSLGRLAALLADRPEGVGGAGDGGVVHAGWKAVPDLEMHERGVLRLDVHKAARELPFVPRLSTDQALSATVDWYKTWIAGGDMRIFTLLQIESLGALDA